MNRLWLIPVAGAQAAGFLTLTPPSEAIENLGLWWALVTALVAP